MSALHLCDWFQHYGHSCTRSSQPTLASLSNHLLDPLRPAGGDGTRFDDHPHTDVHQHLSVHLHATSLPHSGPALVPLGRIGGLHSCPTQPRSVHRPSLHALSVGLRGWAGHRVLYSIGRHRMHRQRFSIAVIAGAAYYHKLRGDLPGRQTCWPFHAIQQ